MCRSRPSVTLESAAKLVSRRVFMKFAIKVYPTADYEGPDGEQMYSSILSSSSTLDRLGVQRNAPAALPPGKTRYPLYRRLVWPSGMSGRVLKSRPPPGFDPRAVQPVASRFAD